MIPPDFQQLEGSGSFGVGGLIRLPQDTLSFHMAENIDNIEIEALASLKEAVDDATLEQWRITWLGSKGRLKSLMAGMKTCTPEGGTSGLRSANERIEEDPGIGFQVGW